MGVESFADSGMYVGGRRGLVGAGSAHVHTFAHGDEAVTIDIFTCVHWFWCTLVIVSRLVCMYKTTYVGTVARPYPVAAIVSRLVCMYSMYRYLMCRQRAARLSKKWVASVVQEGSLLMYMRIGFVWKPDAVCVCVYLVCVYIQLVCAYLVCLYT